MSSLPINSQVLTWTCLFPPDASFRCDVDTPWVRELLETHGGGERPVWIAHARSWEQLPNLDAMRGLVAVNCRGVTEARLRQAGFSYIRHFAFLPGLSQPRWFIPLERPAASAAALTLCNPYRLSARIKKHLAGAAARAGLAGWYRDHVWIAQRATPPLEQVLHELFPDRSLHIGMSSGRPPPTRNRKVTLVVLDSRGTHLAFVKLPGAPISKQCVEHEAEVLAALASRGAPAPRLLFSGILGGTRVSVTSPLPGRPPGTRIKLEHEQFLQTLRSAETRPAAQTAFIRSIRDRAELLQGRLDLVQVLQNMLPMLEKLIVPATITHGDFAPWNLRLHDGRITAFDWEYAQLDGLPLIDPTHHLLAVGFLLHNWTTEHALARLHETARSAPLGFEPRHVHLLQAVYLLDYLLRMFGEGHRDDYRRVSWCREILLRLAGILKDESR